MALVWVLMGILVLGGVVVVAAGRGEGLPPAEPDRPDLALPSDRALVRADVDQVRFSVGLRGYRMDEVDDILDRLAEDLDVRDERIAALEQEVSAQDRTHAYAPADEPPGEQAVAPPSEQPVQQPSDQPGEPVETDMQVGRTMIVPFQTNDDPAHAEPAHEGPADGPADHEPADPAGA